MFLNDNQYFYVSLYWKKKTVGNICLANENPKIFSTISRFLSFSMYIVNISPRTDFFYKYFLYSDVQGLT